jgi:hypothetical protein
MQTRLLSSLLTVAEESVVYPRQAPQLSVCEQRRTVHPRISLKAIRFNYRPSQFAPPIRP